MRLWGEQLTIDLTSWVSEKRCWHRCSAHFFFGSSRVFSLESQIGVFFRGWHPWYLSTHGILADNFRQLGQVNESLEHGPVSFEKSEIFGQANSAPISSGDANRLVLSEWIRRFVRLETFPWASCSEDSNKRRHFSTSMTSKHVLSFFSGAIVDSFMNREERVRLSGVSPWVLLDSIGTDQGLDSRSSRSRSSPLTMPPIMTASQSQDGACDDYMKEWLSFKFKKLILLNEFTFVKSLNAIETNTTTMRPSTVRGLLACFLGDLRLPEQCWEVCCYFLSIFRSVHVYWAKLKVELKLTWDVTFQGIRHVQLMIHHTWAPFDLQELLDSPVVHHVHSAVAVLAKAVFFPCFHFTCFFCEMLSWSQPNIAWVKLDCSVSQTCFQFKASQLAWREMGDSPLAAFSKWAENLLRQVPRDTEKSRLVDSVLKG